MRKVLLLALILNIITAKTLAEPVFRFDSTKQNDSNKTEPAPPPRPAYYDAYKQKKTDTPKMNETTQSSKAPAQSEVPAPTLSPEVRQAIQDQLKNIDPKLIEKARPPVDYSPQSY